jgi:hypothetical protein
METADAMKNKLRCADECMVTNKPGDALKLYKEAWEQAEAQEDEDKVWILLSTSNAAIRCNQVNESKQALEKAFAFVGTGIVLGNPLFHLLLGLTYHLLDENPTAKEENFARAIICGGSKIFNGEEEHHVKQLKKTLEFPNVTDTWETYEGCSLDTLNGATGYIARLIESRMGKPLPYDIVECSDDSESEDDDSDSDESEGGNEVSVAVERQAKRQKCEE